MRFRLVPAGLISLGLAASATANILSANPQPPCASEAIPGYPKLGEPPAIALRTASGGSWTPPECTRWHEKSATLVLGLAGRLTSPGGADAMLAKFGAISSLRSIRYWSVTEKKWTDLFVRANALEGAAPDKTRGDFSAADLRSGRDLYVLAVDNRSGGQTISRLHVSELGHEQLVIEVDNVNPLRWSFVTFTGPGNLQTWYFLVHESGDVWRYYSFTRVLYASRLFSAIVPYESYVNRAVAMYRYIGGVPTDIDPPAAP